MARDELSDDYIADLLKQDAEARSIKYSRQGLHAFLPKRPIGQAPKPNTRFLRHILKETDIHNSALLAREAEEAAGKLRRKPEREVGAGPRTAENGGGRSHKRRRLADRDLEGVPDQTRSRGFDRSDDDRRSSRRRSRDRDRRHGHRDGRSSLHDEARGTGSSGTRSELGHRRRDRSSSHARRSDPEDVRSHHRRARHEHRHRQRSRSPSTDQRDRKHQPDDHRRKTRKVHGHRTSPRTSDGEAQKTSGVRRERAGAHLRPVRRASSAEDERKKPPVVRAAASPSSAASSSDPLEAVIGPIAAPRPTLTPVTSRGRGAFTASESLGAHFSSRYDPAMDVRPDSDGDDWDQALEALRDRMRWRQQGADRLKAAGFTDDEINRWEKGGKVRDEGDVRWAKAGEGREWDRGKIVSAGGHVETRPDWGRLKGPSSQDQI